MSNSQGLRQSPLAQANLRHQQAGLDTWSGNGLRQIQGFWGRGGRSDKIGMLQQKWKGAGGGRRWGLLTFQGWWSGRHHSGLSPKAPKVSWESKRKGCGLERLGQGGRAERCMPEGKQRTQKRQQAGEKGWENLDFGASHQTSWSDLPKTGQEDSMALPQQHWLLSCPTPTWLSPPQSGKHLNRCAACAKMSWG